MFQPGELVMYGTTGVCRVESIDRPNLTGADCGKAYYNLKPLQHNGIIYTPVENSKVSIQALTQHYQAAIHSGDRRELIRLMMSIYAKQKQAEAQKRRLGMVDERYMKQAERLLYGELAASLEIPFDQVQSYIARRVGEQISPQA